MLVVACMFCGSETFSQEILKVKYGHDRKEYVRFEYSAFQDGQIHYSNGETSPTYKLNYDFVSGNIFVIQVKGDTVPALEKIPI